VHHFVNVHRGMEVQSHAIITLVAAGDEGTCTSPTIRPPPSSIYVVASHLVFSHKSLNHQ
jgi:hypothetical protein